MKGRKFLNYSEKASVIKGDRKFYIKVSLLVFLVWLILFELVGRYAAKLPTHDITALMDRQIPLVAHFIWPYMLCYIFPFLPLLVVKDYHRLNLTLLSIVLANLSAFILYLIFPIAFPRPVLGQTLSDHLLSVLYQVDFYPGANKLPSLHVTFTWIAYLACRKQRLNKLGDIIVFSLTGLITLSALFVKQHLIADVIVGIFWAFTAWSLAGNLYKFLIDEGIDPRAGLRQMMKKLIPIMLIFVVVIFSIICFYLSRGHKLF